MKALENASSDGSSLAFLEACRPEVEQILEESGVDLWPAEAVMIEVCVREIPQVFKYKAEYKPVEITDKEKVAVDAFLTALKKKREQADVKAAAVA